MPFDPKKYPENWKEIRQRILDRDGHCCRFCGIANYTIIRVHPFKVHGLPLADIIDQPPFAELKATMGQDAVLKISDKEASRFCLQNMKQGMDYKIGGFNYVQIVLTIAHLSDPDPMNCEDENLAALCQRCHNRHDQPMRQANAKETRKAKKQAATGQIDMF